MKLVYYMTPPEYLAASTCSALKLSLIRLRTHKHKMTRPNTLNNADLGWGGTAPVSAEAHQQLNQSMKEMLHTQRMQEILQSEYSSDNDHSTQHHDTIKQREDLVPKLATEMILKYVISNNPRLTYGDAVTASISNYIAIKEPSKQPPDIVINSLAAADWFLRSNENSMKAIFIDMPTLKNAASTAMNKWLLHKERLIQAKTQHKKKLQASERKRLRLEKRRAWKEVPVKWTEGRVLLVVVSPFVFCLLLSFIIVAVIDCCRTS